MGLKNKCKEKDSVRVWALFCSRTGRAIGVGNVSRSSVDGRTVVVGGGAFVLFYVIFLLILGLPIMTMEFAVGRASQKKPGAPELLEATLVRVAPCWVKGSMWQSWIHLLRSPRV